MDKLYIVIPAYNEEETIEEVVASWHEVAMKASEEARLLVIDDGSKDNTYAIISRLAETMPRLEAVTKPNGGHGATLLYGYKYALSKGADYIFQTDSDGQTSPQEFWGFWEKREDCDALIGARTDRQDGFSRRIISLVLKIIIRIIFGVSAKDVNTPFRLMRASKVEKYISMMPEDYNLPNVILTAMFLRFGDRVVFLPITFRPRQGGVNSINVRKISKIGFRALSDFRHIRKEMEGYHSGE